MRGAHVDSAHADGARARRATHWLRSAARAHERDAPEVDVELLRQVAQLVGEEPVGAVIRDKLKRVGEVGKARALSAQTGF